MDGMQRISRYEENAGIDATHVRLEAHRQSATIYVAGPLTARTIRQIGALVPRLPLHVRLLRIDLRSVVLFEPPLLDQLTDTLGQWREMGRGTVRVDFAQWMCKGQARLEATVCC
jgi:hypothetical protein